MCDANGLFDQYESVLPAHSSLPLSTQQDDIDREMRSRNLAKQQQVDTQKREEEKFVEEKRGFPAGTYLIYATFPHRTRGTYKLQVSSINVAPIDAREDVLKEAISLIGMAGLHNYGLITDQTTHIAKVAFVLHREDGLEVPFECLVNMSGHAVKD